MMKRIAFLSLFVCALMMPLSSVHATNGDNIIGVGPIARSMGGVGIASPQDAISAVFANPAAMCFGPYCPSSEFNFAATGFKPDVSAKIKLPGQTIEADSDEKVYPIPAIGISSPITEGVPFWRFGIAAYGVTGLGVDYKGTTLDQPGFYDFGPAGKYPLASGTYTELQIMKFAPSIAFQPFEKLSFGLALHIDYGDLDLQQGGSSGYALGVQGGIIYKATDRLSLGVTYITPQSITHENVTDFDGDGNYDSLKLESPQQAGIGVSYLFPGNWLMMEGDVKWLNWGSANGYEDFDWEDQWVFAVGAQFMPTSKLSLRLGYNYAKSPVNEHNGFNGMGSTNVQGKRIPNYYYETFRIIGFPAVAEHHVTVGVGYQFTPTFSVNLGYMHAFSNTVTESGTNIAGQPVTLESTLSEDALDFGLTWRF